MTPEQAARIAAERHGIDVDDVRVLRATNNVVLRFAGAGVVAKVGRSGGQLAREATIASLLAAAGAPVVPPLGESPPVPRQIDGYEVSFWPFVPSVDEPENDAPALATALADLHRALGRLSQSIVDGLPSFSAELDEARRTVERADLIPSLESRDRSVLVTVHDRLRPVVDAAARHYVIHGAPHTYNVVLGRDGPVFIDFETVCRGPVEWDLAHLPDRVAQMYPGDLDAALLDACRGLATFKTAVWCAKDIERGDLRRHAEHHLQVARQLALTLQTG